MANQNLNTFGRGGVIADQATFDAGLRANMIRVYNYMASGLALSGIVAVALFSSPALAGLFFEVTPRGVAGLNILGWVAIFAPFGLLLSGLGACTAITLRMYAERQGWPLAGIDVELSYVVRDRDARWIDRLITLHGVDDDQRSRLAEVAEKTPVTRAVRAGTEIRTTTGAA